VRRALRAPVRRGGPGPGQVEPAAPPAPWSRACRCGARAPRPASVPARHRLGEYGGDDTPSRSRSAV